MHTRIHAIHTSIHTYMHTCIYMTTCVHTGGQAETHTIYAYTHTYGSAYIQTCRRTHNVCKYTGVHTYRTAYIKEYITYVHTHIQQYIQQNMYVQECIHTGAHTQVKEYRGASRHIGTHAYNHENIRADRSK